MALYDCFPKFVATLQISENYYRFLYSYLIFYNIAHGTLYTKAVY